MTDEPKFCRDCKNYRPKYDGYSSTIKAGCLHPSERSLVTGEANAIPEAMRAGSCGSMGRLWEEKPAPVELVAVEPPKPESEPVTNPYFNTKQILPAREKSLWERFWWL